MNPDDDNYEEPEEEEEPNLLRCPECGSNRWRRNETGHFTQTHNLDTDHRWGDDTDNEYMDVDDYGTWTCHDCGDAASPEADEALTHWMYGD